MSDLAHDIVVRSNFAINSVHRGTNIKRFVDNYMFRDDADEPLVLNDQQHDHYIDLLTQLNSPEDNDANTILNHRLHYDGIGFDKDNLSLTRDEQLKRGNQAQFAYDHGRAVRRMIIGFDTDWLREHHLLDDDVKDPVYAGDLRGHIDQRRLRSAVQDGFQRMFDQSTMHDPQFAAAVQTDTMKVHVHAVVWDQDSKVKNDRGMVNGLQKNSIRTGIADSLDNRPEFVNEVNNLSNVAQSTQQGARFKRYLLKKELYHSALRLDKNSLHTYIDNLAQYDQKTLSNDERLRLSRKIEHDYQKSGRGVKRSHKLSYGQRRIRRQVHAMVRSSKLRDELRRYQAFMGQSKVNGRSQVSKDSRPVYNAMVYEAQRQLMIVEKYRMYQRPRVSAIYANRESELKQRRLRLVERRQKLLRSISSDSLRHGYVSRLLKNPNVMQSLKQQFNNQPLSSTKVYKDLVDAQSDDKHVLSPLTIKVVKNSVSDDKKGLVETELSRNQHFDVDQLTPLKRMQLSQFQSDVDEYEFDAVSFGGLSVKKMHLSHPDDTGLVYPDDTNSIYDRDLTRNDNDVIGVDFDQVLESGPLKPAVDLAVRRQLSKRQLLIRNAHEYLKNTDQLDPQWLVDAKDNLKHQYAVINKSNGPSVKENHTVEQSGYELADKPLDKLVKKHLRDVDGLER